MHATIYYTLLYDNNYPSYNDDVVSVPRGIIKCMMWHLSSILHGISFLNSTACIQKWHSVVRVIVFRILNYLGSTNNDTQPTTGIYMISFDLQLLQYIRDYGGQLFYNHHGTV